MNGFTALVLAGSRGPADPVAVAAGVSHKAMAEVGGEPMVLRVARALAAAGAARIVIQIEDVGVIEALAGLKTLGCAVEAIPAAESPSLSVRAALGKLGTPLLVTTADHALLRPEWVTWFLEHLPEGADIAAAGAAADVVTAAAPETKRTFLRFADISLSGCNLFWLATPRAEGAVVAWRRFEAHRKQPLKLAQMLGPGALLAYATGALTLEGALKRLGKLAGVRAGLVRMPFGEAAIDVDKPSDLDLARRLAARG